LTLALVLVGFNWYTGNSRVERERQELSEYKDSIDENFENRVKDIYKELFALSRSIDEKIDDRINVSSSATRSYVDSQITSVLANELSRLRERKPIPRVQARYYIDKLIEDENYDEAFELLVSNLKLLADELMSGLINNVPVDQHLIVKNGIRPRHLRAIATNLHQVDKRLIREYGDDLRTHVSELLNSLYREPRLIPSRLIRDQYQRELEELKTLLEERMLMDSPFPPSDQTSEDDR
jgi:hypothetical protein